MRNVLFVILVPNAALLSFLHLFQYEPLHILLACADFLGILLYHSCQSFTTGTIAQPFDSMRIQKTLEAPRATNLGNAAFAKKWDMIARLATRAYPSGDGKLCAWCQDLIKALNRKSPLR